MVFTRHVKTADEDPWWPTFKPLDDDGQPHSSRPRVINGKTVQPGDDIAQRIIGKAHAEGLMVMAYYWDACRSAAGALVERAAGADGGIDRTSVTSIDQGCRERLALLHLRSMSDRLSRPARVVASCTLRKLSEASLDEVKVDPGIDRDVVSALLELRA